MRAVPYWTTLKCENCGGDVHFLVDEMDQFRSNIAMVVHETCPQAMVKMTVDNPRKLGVITSET